MTFVRRSAFSLFTILSLTFTPAAIATTVVNPMEQVTFGPGIVKQQETTVVTNSISGVNVTTSAYMVFVPDGSGNSINSINTVASPNYTVYQPAKSEPRSGDPMLAVNPYDASGVAPNRTYLVGVENGNNSRITVWRSDNGGQTGWPASTTVRMEAAGNGYAVDKPSIAVSTYSGTRGYVYVAFVRFAASGPEILVYRSVDGGVTFQHLQDPNLPANLLFNPSDRIHSPMVSVNSTNGDVSVFWVNHATNQIGVAHGSGTSPYGGFQKYAPLSVGRLLWINLDDIGNDRICDSLTTTPDECVQAVSMLAVRYNFIAGRFGVVWHQRETGEKSSNSDVKFVYYTPGSGWGPIRDVAQNPIRDQWAPALDFDGSGNYLVTYYDRRDDTSDVLYRMYSTKLYWDGTRAEASDTNVTYPCAGNTRALRKVIDSPTLKVYTAGEYHDVWFWNDRWISSFVYANCGSSNDEIFLGHIQP